MTGLLLFLLILALVFALLAAFNAPTIFGISWGWSAFAIMLVRIVIESF